VTHTPGTAADEAEPKLEIFRSPPGDLAARDPQDLMAYPFFSLAKSKRVEPIVFDTKRISIKVTGTLDYGIATIWDADVLIWAASQIVEARDHGLPTSRHISGTPYQILRFVGRGTDKHSYDRLKAALARLTAVATSIRQSASRRLHQFSWINEWKEQTNAAGHAEGVSLVLPDWFYGGLLDSSLVLRLDPVYFSLTGGIERWLYRLVRKHAGRQLAGWKFDFDHLHAKSGSAMRRPAFAFYLRRLAATQALPGFELHVKRVKDGREFLAFRPRVRPPVRQSIRALSLKLTSAEKL
jgi:plasmid replication initiation protein